MFPSEKAERMQIRMPDGLRAAIAERARVNRRSANNEVVVLLELALAQSERELNKTALESAGTLARA